MVFGVGVRVVGRWLVVAGGVDGEVAEEFAGGGVDDADVEVVDEHDDVGSGVGSADADVVESAVEAQGDVAVVVDAVVADAVVGVGAAVAVGWLWGGRGRRWRGWRGVGGSGGGGGGCRSSTKVSSRAWSSARVAGWAGWAREPLLHGLLEAFDLAAGGGVVRAGVLLGDAEAASSCLEAVAAAAAAGEAGGEDHAVVGQCRGGVCRGRLTAARNVATTIGPVTRWWAVTGRA